MAKKHMYAVARQYYNVPTYAYDVPTSVLVFLKVSNIHM